MVLLLKRGSNLGTNKMPNPIDERTFTLNWMTDACVSWRQKAAAQPTEADLVLFVDQYNCLLRRVGNIVWIILVNSRKTCFEDLVSSMLGPMILGQF